MRHWPSALATALGAVAVLAGIGVFAANPTATATSVRALSLVLPLLLGGAVLLAAGLHALQASLDLWCGSGGGGCCCGDERACGDCACCGDEETNGSPPDPAAHSH